MFERLKRLFKEEPKPEVKPEPKVETKEKKPKAPKVELTEKEKATANGEPYICLLYTSPSPRDRTRSRMPSSA